jgi:hypothetical protein
MHKTTMRMMKAFIMGKSDVVMAVIIFVKAGTRPKTRTILTARMSRTSHEGMLSAGPPRSMMDMITMMRSRIFHPLLKKFRGQFANKLIKSSTAKTIVKVRLTVWTNESNVLLSFAASTSSGGLYCASSIHTMKFCWRNGQHMFDSLFERRYENVDDTHRNNQDCKHDLKCT